MINTYRTYKKERFKKVIHMTFSLFIGCGQKDKLGNTYYLIES